MTTINVRPWDQTIDQEEAYVHATTVDAIASLHGGKYVRRDVLFRMVRPIVLRSEVKVAVMPPDEETIYGFAMWGPERMLELLYLRKSLSVKRCPVGHEQCDCIRQVFPRAVARDVVRGLLGDARMVRMRRVPSQPWVWHVMHQLEYVPSVMPEAV